MSTERRAARDRYQRAVEQRARCPRAVERGLELLVEVRPIQVIVEGTFEAVEEHHVLPQLLLPIVQGANTPCFLPG